MQEKGKLSRMRLVKSNVMRNDKSFGYDKKE